MKYSKETIADIMSDTAMEAAKASASFNYEAVHSVMESTGRTWYVSENERAIPDIKRIKKKLMELLNSCIYRFMSDIMDDGHKFSKEDDTVYSASSGGLRVDIMFFPFAEEDSIENYNDDSKNAKREWVLVKYKYEICNDLMYFD